MSRARGIGGIGVRETQEKLGFSAVKGSPRTLSAINIQEVNEAHGRKNDVSS